MKMRGNMEKLKIMIADDNPYLLKQLSEKIKKSNSIEIVGMSDNANDTYEMMKKEKPNVMVFDLKLPGNNDNLGKQMDMVISEKLNQLGVPASLKGYRYMITAIKEVLRDETMLDGVTKILYPQIAKEHNSTPQRVEKAIRHAIEVAWARNDGCRPKAALPCLENTGKVRPTNSEFIAVVSQTMKRYI
jgi:two-component system response regulator (stage 0 sporulation protein A)